MDEEDIKKINEILEHKVGLQEWRNLVDFDDIIRKYSLMNVKDEVKKVWEFAFMKADNWDEVEKEVSKFNSNLKIKKNDSSDLTDTTLIKTTKIIDTAKSSFHAKNDNVNSGSLKIVIHFFTEEAYDEFSKIEWKSVFRKIVANKFNKHVENIDNKNTYDIFPKIEETDKFSKWEKDLLFGHMRVLFKTSNGSTFPRIWKIDVKMAETFELEYEKKFERIVNQRNLEFTLDPYRSMKSELISDLHKIKRLLYYEGDKDKFNKIGFLNPIALSKGFEEQQNDPNFDGGPIMIQIQRCLEQFVEPSRRFISPSHGMILWGPPGTGKTSLCKVLCRKSGIELVVEPLASSELNRSKVGETEELIMMLFNRAKRMPHLMCCIAIDEIDALTPKRNEKTGEHKVDVLCLLLSLIGGIKDVPNVFVIASTNRLNKMDEAICRRLQTKFFVGRLDPKRRLDILLKVCEELINDQKVEFPHELHEYTKQLSINFSGAAMASFRSDIMAHLQYTKRNLVQKEMLIEMAQRVARDYQILLGSSSIPQLINGKDNVEYFNIEYPEEFTGRILFDLSIEGESNMQLEYLNTNKVMEIPMSSVKFTYDVVPFMVKMCINVGVDFVQMFDTSMLLNNAAYDDNTVMETILEKIGEWEQYPRSMAIFDVDSLVGVNENMSDSSMGQSLSYSITNNRLWQQVVIQTANSKLNIGDNNNDHKWIVVITKNSFISRQFKTLSKFPLSPSELLQEKLNSQTKTCYYCRMPFCNLKNGIDACSYHDGLMVDITKEQTLKVTYENLLYNARSPKLTADQRQKLLQNHMYLCCFQQYNSMGCKKGKHTDKPEEKRINDYIF